MEHSFDFGDDGDFDLVAHAVVDDVAFGDAERTQRVIARAQADGVGQPVRDLPLVAWQAELAEAIDIPEGTVGSRLNRARHELQQHLTDLGWEP